MYSVRAAIVASVFLAAPLAAQTFSAERIKADVEFLADDLLEGRNAGTRGYDLAALYVAKRFAALGLTPGKGTSWFQNVPLGFAALRTDAQATVTIGGQGFANGVDVLMGGSYVQPDQMVDAQAVFVGYGMESKRYGLDDYRGLDVAGKVVVYVRETPADLPSDVAATLADQRLALARSKGAIGAIVLLTPNRIKQRGWALLRSFYQGSGIHWLHSDGRPNDATPGLFSNVYLAPKATEALLRGTPLAADRLYAQIADGKTRPKGFAIPGTIRVERHSRNTRIDSPNVVGLLPGSDPALSNEVILLTAHLDHNGIGEPKAGDAIYNGAMDNASGVATMLEAARAFAESGVRPKRSILFVALTAEEDGLLGAEYLAKYPALKGKRPVGLVNLDMPILTYDFQDVVAFGAEHSTMGPAVARAAAKAGIALSPDPVPEQGLFTRSDHYKFVLEGVPSVYLVTGYAGPGKAASDQFLSDHYHQPSDSPALLFDWAAGAKFARINYLIARELADGVAAPRWYADSFFGQTFAKDQPKARRP